MRLQDKERRSAEGKLIPADIKNIYLSVKEVKKEWTQAVLTPPLRDDAE
jgi:hypothetical protein